MPRIRKPATKARRKKEDESRHATVLDAAEKVFQVEGYQTATAEKIAASAGVSVGTIYNLFGSKKRIYAGIISRIAQQMLDYMKNSILPIEDSALAIERLILFRLSNFERQRLFLVLFSCERSSGAYPDRACRMQRSRPCPMSLGAPTTSWWPSGAQASSRPSPTCGFPGFPATRFSALRILLPGIGCE